MKKVLFCLSLIFGLLVLNQVPSFAMEFTISPESIGGLGDLGYGLLGGASFDFDGTEYQIQDFDSLSEAIKEQKAQEQARKFLQAYCIQRGIPIPNIDPDLPASDPKAFYKSQYFNSANRTVWNNYKLGSTTIEQQEALRFPISPQSFSDWTEYNTFWYKKYIAQFEISSDDPVDPTPTPGLPQEYSQYEVIGSDTIGTSNVNVLDTKWSWSKYTVTDETFGSDAAAGALYGTQMNTGNFLESNKRGFALYGSTSNIQINDTGTGSYRVYWYLHYNSDATIGGYNSFSNCYYNPSVDRIIPSSGHSLNTVGESGNTTFATLSQALDYINTRFRHIDVYVNSELWIKATGAIDPAPANPTIPDFPDVIGGTDDDPIPAYDVILPDTSDQYGTFDITSLFDAIKEAIIGASDSDDSTSGILTGDAVKDTFKDRAGEAVGELTDTIDAILDDSFPLENTSNYPNLPPIPDMPISDAFAGTTILAQLIDACQQILPEPLTLAFWGMIFILFIIGLIRILHK